MTEDPDEVPVDEASAGLGPVVFGMPWFGQGKGWDLYTYRRPSDGALVSGPSGTVIGPPLWAQYILDQLPGIVREIVREELDKREK